MMRAFEGHWGVQVPAHSHRKRSASLATCNALAGISQCSDGRHPCALSSRYTRAMAAAGTHAAVLALFLRTMCYRLRVTRCLMWVHVGDSGL